MSAKGRKQTFAGMSAFGSNADFRPGCRDWVESGLNEHVEQGALDCANEVVNVAKPVRQRLDLG